MNTLTKALAFITVIFLYSFSSYAQNTNDVLMLSVDEEAPAVAPIGKVRVIDKGLKIICDYETTMRQAKEKAVKMGDNVIKITKLKKPGIISTCWQLWGEVYRIENTEELMS